MKKIVQINIPRLRALVGKSLIFFFFLKSSRISLFVYCFPMSRKICSAILFIFILSNVESEDSTQQKIIPTCPSLVNFTSSFPYQHSLTNENSYKANSSQCYDPNEFTHVVQQVFQKSTTIDYQTYTSILQELMVRGFQLLCSWTRPLKQKIELANKLKSSSDLSSIPDVLTTSSNYIYLTDITLNGFPAPREKSFTNFTHPKCSTSHKIYYEANSEIMTICGNAMVNGAWTNFIIAYRNVSLKICEMKTCTPNGDLITDRVKEDFQFENCTAQSTDINLNIDSVLEEITPALIKEIFKTDPTRRLTYASLSQDCKITEIYKQSILKSMSNLLVVYLNHACSASYLIPASYSLSAEIERIQIQGLNSIRVCSSKMQMVRRESKLIMKLTFRLKFRDETNNTALIIKQYDIVQPRSIFIKQFNIRLDYSSPIDDDHDFGFHLVRVRVEIFDKYSTLWYKKFAPIVNAVFGDIIKKTVLAWILYEDN